jgi:hypothetical protein
MSVNNAVNRSNISQSALPNPQKLKYPSQSNQFQTKLQW